MSILLTGGRFKGRILKTPPSSEKVRPTSGKVREALFSILQTKMSESTFADMFAGTGSVGLEALSRGASKVDFFEKDPEIYELLQSNCQSLKLEKKEFELYNADALNFSSHWHHYDIVFVDPPFHLDFENLLNQFMPWVGNSGDLVIQFPSRTPPSWVGTAYKTRAYGESGLAFFSCTSLE